MGEAEIDFRDFFGLLRRRARLILFTVALSLSATGVALHFLPPDYTAQALVLVDTNRADLVDSSRTDTRAIGESTRVDSEVEIIGSDKVALAVIEAEGLVGDPDFASRPPGWIELFGLLRFSAAPADEASELAKVLERVKKRVQAQRVGLTLLISISATARTPVKAARIANAFAGHYIEAQIVAKTETIRQAQTVLEARVVASASAAAAADASLELLLVSDAGAGQQAQSAQRETQIAEMRHISEIAQSQYHQQLTRLRELQSQAISPLADSRIVSAALPPAGPSFPDIPLTLAIVGMLSLGIGMLLAFAYENLVGGFSSAAQLEAALQVPVASVVPHAALPVHHKNGDRLFSAADLMTAAPVSAYAEAIRRLRLVVERALLHDEPQDDANGAVVMVCSALAGEGKSAIALSLGRALSETGTPALLVDCDLRRPMIDSYLGLEASLGLADYLTHPGDDVLSRIVVRDHKSALNIVLGADTGDAPTDQLSASSVMAGLIAAARKKARIVIVDTPPLLPVIDGLYLAEHADLVLLVTRWGDTPQRDARESLQALRSMRQEPLPVLSVLNRYGKEPGKFAYLRPRPRFWGRWAV